VVSAHIKEKPEHNKVCTSGKCKEVPVYHLTLYHRQPHQMKKRTVV